MIHETADGRKLLVLHGDVFDGMIRHARWISVIGARAYHALLFLNRWVNRCRRLFGMPYWSLSAYLKHRTKRAVQFIANFENAMVGVAKAKNADGVVCGHVHFAEIRKSDPFFTRIQATGWRVVPDWLSILMADWSSCTGSLWIINLNFCGMGAMGSPLRYPKSFSKEIPNNG